MSGIKDKRDDGQWGIKVQQHKGELKHDTNSSDCWCCPDEVQPCRACGVQFWSDSPVDEVADDPDKLPLMEKFRAQADKNCPTCCGRGLETKYDEELAVLIMHH